MIDKVLFGIGFWMFILGLAGLGAACEGKGSFLISAIVMAIGLGISLYEMKRGTECE